MAKSKIVTGLKDAARYSRTSAEAAAAFTSIAESIESISAGVHSLRNGRLTDRALYLLIQDAAPSVKGKKPTVQQIKAVIEALGQLRGMYVKKPAHVA